MTRVKTPALRPGMPGVQRKRIPVVEVVDAG